MRSAGSVFSISEPTGAARASRVSLVTMLGGATGGLATLFTNLLLGDKTWSVPIMCNGILAGLVSVTACCAVVTPYNGIVIGLVSGWLYSAASHLVLHRLKVDDTVDAFAVHGVGGLWGVVAASLFATDEYGGRNGLFYGEAELLGAAAVGTLAIVAWSVALSLLLFFGLSKAGRLRIPPVEELVGMDRSALGGSAYGHDATEVPSGAYAQAPRYEQPPPYMAAGGPRSIPSGPPGYPMAAPPPAGRDAALPQARTVVLEPPAAAEVRAEARVPTITAAVELSSVEPVEVHPDADADADRQ